ncbi:putative serine esterase-domain-containing protein [Xylariaceae sp. FL0016]|nr:putative serine esterase-domain-containing protein [Xylariaceae sp. FL0016]
MTYPDQPFLPLKKKAAGHFAHTLRGEDARDDGTGRAAHKHSTIHQNIHPHHDDVRKFQITSISFIGHSLGGLVQTYAIAYIQKHSPQFFDLIRPINFIALASPLLGLSNENPLYVKFALDFGLVGRTGQDLGLTWRAPTIARSGWGALVGTLGESAHKKVMGEVQAESKPLLRILPTGPAHTALKKFRNRTVYSNVVNDGIVPLRTSCLLFLDWQGLDRVEKARREAGLVETMVGFGWAELTGANVSSARKSLWSPQTEEPPSRSDGSAEDETTHEDSREVPQPPSNATVEDDRHSLNLATPYQESGPSQNSQTNNDYPFSGFFNFFKGEPKSSESQKSSSQKTPPRTPRESKIYQRSQTLKVDESTTQSASSSRSRVSSGQEFDADQQGSVSSTGVSAPPRTTFLESAGDLLNPKLPSVEYLLDPSKRPRTIFHDRIYHPSDIPPPPLKKRPTGSLSIRRKATSRSASSSPKRKSSNGSASSPSYKGGVQHEDSGLSTRDYDDPHHTDPDRESDDVIDSSSMRVEEKIARAYHRDLSWRKVLVKLEPDAHNNIIVRRTFANAFGWPVVKHLVDAHFSDAAAARLRDENEENVDRAKALSKPPDETGAETGTQQDAQPRDKKSNQDDHTSQYTAAQGEVDTKTFREETKSQEPMGLGLHGRTRSEALEATDAVPGLPTSKDKSRASHSFQESPPRRPHYDRAETTASTSWHDSYFADSGDESSDVDIDMAYGRYKVITAGDKQGTEKEGERSSSPVWNWTEKIVGKSAVKKKGTGPKSPTGESRPASGHDGAAAAGK